jgi:diaminohydroxyphosphoribosylaminopyrimidine deaminase/5-amino-6-(5-phosphoribosylamino)uracil reductase
MDQRWMAAALSLAHRSAILARPNPAIACLIVRDGVLLARGVTAPGGRPHAEASAISAAKRAGITDFSDCDFYVTLEPCAHISTRGPACADLVAAAKPRRVIIALTDPDARTASSGIERLLAANIAVETGICAKLAERSLAGYLSQRRKSRPHIMLKIATSLDGQIALANGESQWITGDQARAHGHAERARQDVILVGGETLRHDKPRLNVRLPGLEGRSPRRAVLTRQGAVEAQHGEGWLTLSAPSAIADIIDAHHVMVEGGAGAAAAFLADDLVDELLVYRAPIMIGKGRAALGDIGLRGLGDAHDKWALIESRMLGKDRMERYWRIRA